MRGHRVCIRVGHDSDACARIPRAAQRRSRRLQRACAGWPSGAGWPVVPAAAHRCPRRLGLRVGCEATRDVRMPCPRLLRVPRHARRASQSRYPSSDGVGLPVGSCLPRTPANSAPSRALASRARRGSRGERAAVGRGAGSGSRSLGSATRTGKSLGSARVPAPPAASDSLPTLASL